MRVLVVMCDMEDYSAVESALMVPDEFDLAEDKKAAISEAIDKKMVRSGKWNGGLHRNDIEAFDRLYVEGLRARFKSAEWDALYV